LKILAVIFYRRNRVGLFFYVKFFLMQLCRASFGHKPISHLHPAKMRMSLLALWAIC